MFAGANGCVWYNTYMEKDIFNINQNELTYVEDMSIPCSTILYGARNTEKRF